MTSPDGHRFTEHAVISRMRHHCRGSTIPLASATPDLTSLDWCILIPATIQAQSDGMVVAVYNTLRPSEEELLAESRSFVTYVQTLPLVSQQLIYQIRFVPGSECTLQDFLHENKKLWAARDGSLNQDAVLASHG
jgi:hypothetical protein